MLPSFPTRRASDLVGFEIRPAAETGVPMLAVGSGGQTLEWIARNAAGWATYHRPPAVQRDRHALWRRAVDRVAPGEFRSFSRSEEHTSELQSLMRISYAVFCLKKKNNKNNE